MPNPEKPSRPNEADTCRRYVVPKLQAAGWENEPHHINEQVTFTDGRVIVASRRGRRRPGKRADYILRYPPNFAIAVIEIERAISRADACFAEITTDNPNVWFELGFAIARVRPVCLVCSKERATPFPFDVRHRNGIEYDARSLSDFK